MSVRAGTTFIEQPAQCVICRHDLDPQRADRGAMYCSNACSMKAYRRRKHASRIEQAEKELRAEEARHQAAWVRFLIDAGGLSRRQADRLYVALSSLRRLDGPPFEQLEMLER